MLDPGIGFLLLGCFALLFVSAALQKLRALPRFAEVLRAYRVLPAAAAQLAVLVPLLELAVGVALLVPGARSGAAAAGAALLALYAGSIALNLARGRRDLACGCGGPDERRPISAWMVWRNILLALMLGWAFAPWTLRVLTLTDEFTVIFGVLTIALIYLCADQLLGNAQRSAQLKGSR